jgi:hypothetical protein
MSLGVALAVLLGIDQMYRATPMSAAIDKHDWVPVKRAQLLATPADIVVAGSSVIGEGMNPAAVSERIQSQTGQTLSVYNFGMGAGSFAGYLFVANAILEIPKEQRPRMFIVALSPMEFSCCPQVEVPSSAKWSTGIRLRDLPGLLRAVATFEEASADITLATFRLLATRSYVLASLFDRRGVDPPNNWGKNGGGGGIGPVDPGTQDARARGRAAAYRPTMMKPKSCDREVSASYLRSMTHRLHAEGIDVAFIGAHQARQMDVLDGPDSIYPEYEQFVTELGRELGTGFENFRATDELTNADFVDGDHLNAGGAVKFSRMLADRVIIPRLREDRAGGVNMAGP